MLAARRRRRLQNGPSGRTPAAAAAVADAAPPSPLNGDKEQDQHVQSPADSVSQTAVTAGTSSTTQVGGTSSGGSSSSGTSSGTRTPADGGMRGHHTARPSSSRHAAPGAPPAAAAAARGQRPSAAARGRKAHQHVPLYTPAGGINVSAEQMATLQHAMQHGFAFVPPGTQFYERDALATGAGELGDWEERLEAAQARQQAFDASMADVYGMAQQTPPRGQAPAKQKSAQELQSAQEQKSAQPLDSVQQQEAAKGGAAGKGKRGSNDSSAKGAADCIGDSRDDRTVASSVMGSDVGSNAAGRQAQDQAAKACVQCGGVEGPLKKCAGCGQVRYCSIACQRLHWRTVHRSACSKEFLGGHGSAAAGSSAGADDP